MIDDDNELTEQEIDMLRSGYMISVENDEEYEDMEYLRQMQEGLV